MPRKSISFELDFMTKDILPKFTVKQFDDISFNIKPKNQGLDYNTAGMTGKIFIGINNDVFMQTTGITVSSNNINVLLDKNMLQKNGKAYAEIELTDSNGTISSSSFIFNIDPKIGEGGMIPGEYEGFVEKYERLISEFKSQVNKTISNCNANVDNKLNTVDSLINVKISDFEKRFNRLTSSQQQDAEVIDARTDFKGEVFDSLKERIDYTDKLLRESTVSTVTTESDFTTVEATSNGYFEDVKLEGKTLVNLGGKVRGTYNKYSTLLNSIQLLAPNSEYTFIISNTAGHNVDLYINEVIFNNQPTFTVKANSTSIVSCTTKDIVNQLPLLKSSSNDGTIINLNVILLEGDHTQNPPSYFEGLKSVGDGVDEIVVSSVNENLFDGVWENGGINNAGEYTSLNCLRTKEYMHVVPNGAIIVDYPSNYAHTLYIHEYDNNFKVCCNEKLISTTNNTFVTDARTRYIKINTPVLTNLNTSLPIGNMGVRLQRSQSEEVLHQSDKKRLLFYNEETQTWEKPILREWDSIEKHSNGKYYYHQRSGEVVLNGSEDWLLHTTNYFKLAKTDMKIFANTVKPNMISDRYVTMSLDNSNTVDSSISNGNGNPHIYIYNKSISTVEALKQSLQANNVTVVYQLAEEKVYECTNIDLITYEGETNYIIECGAIAPKSILKVHNNISNVVSLLQKKVSLLESNITNYMIIQNRMQLASTYSADSVTFKVDYALCSEEVEYNEDLYNLILNNILVGKDNYDYDKMFAMILDYASWNQISWEQFDILVGLMDIQHNPPIEEIPTDDEIVEEIPNEIM